MPVQSSFTELKGQFAKIQHDLCLAQQKIQNLDVTCKNLAQEKTALAEQFSQLGDKIELYEKTASAIISTQDEIIYSYKEIVDSGNLLQWQSSDEGMILMMDQLHLSNPGKSFIYKCFCFLGHNSTSD